MNKENVLPTHSQMEKESADQNSSFQKHKRALNNHELAPYKSNNAKRFFALSYKIIMFKFKLYHYTF